MLTPLWTLNPQTLNCESYSAFNPRPAFLNPNYSATRFSQDLKLLDTGHSLFKPIFTLLLYPHLKKIFRDCLRSYNKIKYVFLANFFQLRNEKCSLTFLCYFLATRFKSSMSRYWVATRRLRNPALDHDSSSCFSCMLSKLCVVPSAASPAKRGLDT